MKKIGIIGGAGPLASALLYKTMIEICYSQGVCNEEIPEIVIINHPFSVAMLQNSAQTVAALQSCMNNLIEADCEVVAIACNSLHAFLPTIALGNAELVEIQKPVLEKIGAHKLKNVLLLGTKTTVKSQMYQSKSTHIIIPSGAEQKTLDGIIEKVLEGAITSKESSALSALIRDRCASTSIEGVILGCTELPVLHKKYPIQLPTNKIMLLNTVELLAKELVHKALEQKEVHTTTTKK